MKGYFYLASIIFYSFNLLRQSSSYGVGVPCLQNPCPFNDSCVNRTDTGAHICVCRLQHMNENGTWKKGFEACTTDYSPWGISPRENGMKLASPIYDYEFVPNKAFKSTGVSPGYSSSSARLQDNIGKGGWCAPTDNYEHRIQVYLGNKSKLTMIASQGSATAPIPYVVTSFKIEYSDDGLRFRYLKNSSNHVVVFDRQVDNNHEVAYNFIDPPLYTSYINIVPVEFINAKCLRLELYGRRDVDECVSGWANCDRDATCNDTFSAYTCKCPTGYDDVHGNGFLCDLVNECTDTRPEFKHQCDPEAVCTDTITSYTCKCKPGNDGDGYYCEDSDECQSDNVCNKINGICKNDAGSYTCECKLGFKGDGITCTDEDECRKKSHACHKQAKCINSYGSYNCYCRLGYEGNGRYCVDIDECVREKPCHTQARCENNQGSYKCICNDGFTGSGRWCTDVNECQENPNICKPSEKCYNVQGSYICMCPKHIPLQDRYRGVEADILDGLITNIRDISVEDWRYPVNYHAHIIRSLYNLVRRTYEYHFKESRDYFSIEKVVGDALALELYEFRCTEVLKLNFPNLCHRGYENTKFLTFSDIVDVFLTNASTPVFEEWATTDPPRPPLRTTFASTPPSLITNRVRTTRIVYINGTNVTVTESPLTIRVPFTSCGGYRNTSGRIIESPRSKTKPQQYPPDSRCEWIIEAPKAHDVYIEFESFDLEYDMKCSYDFLEVRDNTIDGRLLGKYCGNKHITPIRSSHGKLAVIFESDSSRQHRGFNITATFLNPRASIICITYNQMSTLPSSYAEQWKKDIKNEDPSNYVSVARLITCKQYPKCHWQRPKDMIFTFEHFRYDRNDKVCIHWDVDVPATSYSMRPCWLLKTNMTHTICQCHTWGIVTVLGRISKQVNLEIKDRIDLGRNSFWSVLLVTIGLAFILIYLLFRDQWGAAIVEVFTKKEYDSGRVIQLHIIFSTLLTEFLFFIITFLLKANIGVCYFFTFVFYYILQTVFFWLFVYTLFLETRIREIFDSGKYNTYKIYLFIGYVVPFCVTLSISGLEFQEDTRQKLCWLMFKGTSVWGFSGVIVSLGVFSLILLFHVIYNARNMENGIVLQEKCLRTMIITFFILLSAVYGARALQKRNYSAEYIFSLCNMLQGFAIAIIFCILRREDPIIRANQIGPIAITGTNDEMTAKNFFDDGEDVFKDMTEDACEDNESDEEGNNEGKTLRDIEEVIAEVPKQKKKRERIIRFEEEEPKNEEATVDEPVCEDSNENEDNEDNEIDFRRDETDDYA